MQLTLKQAIKLFLTEYKPDVAYRPFSEKDAGKLARYVPEIVLELARMSGWCSYNQGMLWLCHPDAWIDVADPWLPVGRGRATILARTAFGEFVALRGSKIWLVFPHSASRVRMSDDPNSGFG